MPGRQKRPQKHAGRRAHEGRTRRRARVTPLEVNVDVGPPPGAGVVSASLDEVVAALERHSDDLGWSQVADRVLPILPRVRPYHPGYPALVQTLVPPGLVVGVGVDIGPAFMGVNPELLASWELPLVDVLSRAIENVHERAARVTGSQIVRGPIDDVPTECLQTGASIGSALVFAPTELRRLFGPAHRTFITPMRDLIVGLPAGVDPSFAWWLYHEFAGLDPNCLGPMGFAFDGERVTPWMLPGPPPGWAGAPADLAASL
jgi:hypothetical protein